ncbi:hypothetical protein [Lentzea pudingi]|nr:hypothetical protein [Lentzea pudingi]
MAANASEFVPEIELSAYERERPVFEADMAEVRRVRFYAPGHRWPLVLDGAEIAAALHKAVGPLPQDVDELAEIAFWSVQHYGLDAVAGFAQATRDMLARTESGQLSGTDHAVFLVWWNSVDRYRACVRAAGRLCAYAPRSPRVLPPVDDEKPWELA